MLELLDGDARRAQLGLELGLVELTDAFCGLSPPVPSGSCPSVRRRRSRAQVLRMGLGMCFLASKAPLRRRLAGSADGTAHSSTAGKSHREGADVIGRTICRRPGARGTSIRRLREVTPRAGGVRGRPSPAAVRASDKTQVRGRRGTPVGLRCSCGASPAAGKRARPAPPRRDAEPGARPARQRPGPEPSFLINRARPARSAARRPPPVPLEVKIIDRPQHTAVAFLNSLLCAAEAFCPQTCRARRPFQAR